MRAKLYSLSLSHPSHAARLMLERKRIAYELVDELIAADTIGGAEPNAADFQIATVRVLVAFDDLRAAVRGRPAEALARRLLPSYPEPIPRALPGRWLTPLGAR